MSFQSLAILLLIIELIAGRAAKGADFIYHYDIKEEIAFDFSKSYSVKIGEITLFNDSDRPKKFRYYRHSPRGYFYNKKDNSILELAPVVDSTKPEKADSLFWALLDSATYYTPVKAKESITLSAYINLNFYHDPRRLIAYVLKYNEYLEYRLVTRDNFSNEESDLAIDSYDANIKTIGINTGTTK